MHPEVLGFKLFQRTRRVLLREVLTKVQLAKCWDSDPENFFFPFFFS